MLKEKRLNLIDKQRALSKEIKELSRQIDKDYIFNDFTLFDKIDELKRFCDKGHLEKAEYIARQITNALTVNNIVRIEKNNINKIEEYSKQPAPNNFPNAFNLGGIEIMRGINVGVGSYPGIGKTTFACNMAYYNMTEKKLTLFISLEMPTVHIFIKLYLLYLYYHENRQTTFVVINDYIKHPVQNQIEYQKFIDFVNRTEKHLIIVDYENLTATQITYLMDEAKKEFGKFPDWVIIDYIQLIQPELKKPMPTRREMTIFLSLLFTLKAKKELSNFLLLSQLNEKGEFREAANVRDNVGMSLKLSREIDDDGDFKPVIEIKIDKSRYTRLTKSTVNFIGKAGVIGG